LKDLLSLEYYGKRKLYEWQRGISNDWIMLVLNGNAILHVQGSKELGYWGDIQLSPNFDPLNKSIFKTCRELSADTFRLPEHCAQYLENKWKEIISAEEKQKINSVNDE
jgi:hypothetical protein